MGRQECCDPSFRRGLGLEELIGAIFTTITLEFNKFSVSRMKHSTLQRHSDAAGDQHSISSQQRGWREVSDIFPCQETVRMPCEQGVFALAVNLTFPE